MRDSELLYFDFPHASTTRDSARGEIRASKHDTVVGSMTCSEFRQPGRIPKFTKVTGARCSVSDADKRPLWTIEQFGSVKAADHAFHVTDGNGSSIGPVVGGVLAIDGMPVAERERSGFWSVKRGTKLVSAEDGSEVATVDWSFLGSHVGICWEVRFAPCLTGDLRAMVAAYAYACSRTLSESN